MQSSLKKSLYLGLAALSFAGVAAVSTTASAKSAAKVTSDKVMKSDATTRNINLTGKNAIYTKPGTVKGSKVVATTTTTKNLKNDKTSQKNFRAYRMAKTNRGSYYYKVVSFDKQYRGWVYGGKTANEFNGGVSAYTTFKEGTLTDAQKSTTYKITKVGKANDGSQVTYKAPAWTQYKVGRAITDTSAYTGAKFSIDKVGTRTREGDTWVHIVNTNAADTKANGWILFSALSDANPLADNAVRVNLVGQNGESLGSFDYAKDGASKGATLGELKAGTDVNNNSVWSWTLDQTTDEPALLKQVNDTLKGTGYTTNGVLTDAQQATLAQGKFGSSVTLNFAKGNVVYTQFTPTSRSTSASSLQGDPMTAVTVADADKTTIPASALTDTVKFSSTMGTDSVSDVSLNLKSLYTGDADSKALVNQVTDAAADPTNGAANLKAANDAIAADAAVSYLAPKDLQVSDLFSGSKGADFTADQALAYLKGNKELNNLKSGVYPEFDAKGNITWKQLTYTPTSADAGTFGTNVNAVFSYDFNQAATVAKPSVSASATDDSHIANPLA